MHSQEAGARGNPEQPDGSIGTTGLAKGLGWFSLGLGIAELAAPGRSRARSASTPRATPARRSASWAHASSRPASASWPGRGARSRCGPASPATRSTWRSSPGRLGARRTHTQRLVGAIASVAGVTALDVIAGRRAARAEEASLRPVRRAITIYRPTADVYSFWRDLDQLPMFMTHLESVTELGGGRSRFTAKLPTGGTMSWDTELTEDLPGERIDWSTVRGSKLPNRGSVTFRPVLGGSATEVCVELQLGHGAVAELAKLFAGGKLMADLRRLKQLLETGEIVRSDASIHAGPHPARPARRTGKEQP